MIKIGDKVKVLEYMSNVYGTIVAIPFYNCIWCTVKLEDGRQYDIYQKYIEEVE